MQELAKTKLAVGGLINTTGMVNTRVDYVEKTNLDQWAEIKEKKLILSGIPESKGENVKAVVVNKLQAVLKKSTENQQLVEYKGAKFATNADSFRSSTMDCTYRLGKFKKGASPQNILVSFVKADDKKLILRAKNTIDMSLDMKFYINEDLALDTRNQRASIKRLSKTGNEQGFDSKVSGDKLIVGGTTYDSCELDILPSHILRSTAQEKWVQGGLAFRGERSVFSNFYTKPFIVDGHRYISVEQFFQYSKAVYFEDSKLARKITLTSDPKRIQSLGDRIKVSGDEWDEWLACCQEFLYDGMLAKFTQNSSLKKDLLSTGECQLL